MATDSNDLDTNCFDDLDDLDDLDGIAWNAWADRLAQWLPSGPADVLDLGCGTGSLALLAAERGHRVTAVDSAPRMVEQARAKLAGTGAEVLVGDASRPPLDGGRRFDVILARHVVRTLPDPEAALHHWCTLLRPGGRLVLVEGVWGEQSHPLARLTRALAPLAGRVHTESLSSDARLWGGPVTDERYALVAVVDGPRRHREVVDVHLIVRRGDEVLLARRAGTGYADGLLHAPSGHTEDGEDVRAAVIREAEEEVGLRLAPEDVRVALVMQHRGPGAAPRIGWFFEADHGAGGTPVNREPEKCSELGWYALDALPDDLVAYCRAGLDAYRAGERFVLHWHEDDDPIAYEPTIRRAVPLPMSDG